MNEADTANDLKVIRLNTAEIDEPDAPHAANYPYKLTANLQPPDFMQVAFICRYGGSEELIVRGKTRAALDRFIEQHKLTQDPRLRSLMITGPDGVTEEIRRCPR